jgi:beta propeller repeat protein
MSMLRRFFIFVLFSLVLVLFSSTVFAVVPTETRLTTNSANQSSPDVSGDVVVWQDNRLGS